MSQRNTRKAKSDTAEYAQVKQHMVQACIDLLTENKAKHNKSFQQFRFEEFAEKVGYNRATIYRYFDSKQDLFREVMLALMQEITEEIIHATASTKQVTQKNFSEALYKLIQALRVEPRYAMIMDAENVETFSRLTHEFFADITSMMIEKFMLQSASGRVLKQGLHLEETVSWLMHQIISYGFFGIPGSDEKTQKQYLKKMVVSVIVE